MNSSVSRTTLLSIFFVVISFSSACFITNCPPGGKRSLSPAGGRSRQCMSCGPGGEGHCVGPDTCCGPSGCVMKSPETMICRLEILNPHLCTPLPNARPCGQRSGSICAANGLCCSSDSCSIDKSCLQRINSYNQGLEAASDSNELDNLQIGNAF